jgi:hypothetical protein
MSNGNFPVINRPILEQVIAFHRSRLQQYETIKADCTTCEHFKQANQECAKYSAVIPEEVVAKGCHEWSYDYIPF